MKKLFFPLFGFLLISIISCNSPKNESPVPQPSGVGSALSFPCLLYSTDSVSTWVNDKAGYDEFIFNFYYTKPGMPSQLLAYGRHQTINSTYDYTPLSNPFTVYDSSLSISDTDYALGNLLVKADSVSRIIAALPKIGGNMFLFVPVIDTYKFKHVAYHLYLCDYAYQSKSITKIIDLSQVFPSKKYLYVDANGREYIDLNPCPPAHN